MLGKTAAGVFTPNVAVPKSGGGYWPTLFDLYVPAGQIRMVAVILHGGLGSKENIASACGLTSGTPSQFTARWDLLQLFRCAVLVPQGQAADGTVSAWNPNGANTINPLNPRGAPTWSNWVMWSGNDDKSMLQDMSAYIASNFGLSPRTLLAGHSNGGMMTHRIWAESPSWFNLYASACGPMSHYYDPTLPAPSTVRPLYSRWSLGDDTVGIFGGDAGDGVHFWDDVWIQNPDHQSVADYYYPVHNQFVAGWRSFQNQVARAGYTWAQADGVAAAMPGGGTMTTWQYGDHRMEVMDQGNHGLQTQTPYTRRKMIVDWLTWAYSTLPPG